jgi:hypothetical protein
MGSQGDGGSALEIVPDRAGVFRIFGIGILPVPGKQVPARLVGQAGTLIGLFVSPYTKNDQSYRVESQIFRSQNWDLHKNLMTSGFRRKSGHSPSPLSPLPYLTCSLALLFPLDFK